VCIADEVEAVLVAASQELVLKHRLSKFLDVVRGCQPRALGLTVRRDLIPVYLGWIIAWAVSTGIPGWECCDGDPRVARVSVVRGC
jgi:hypothetical protein